MFLRSHFCLNSVSIVHWFGECSMSQACRDMAWKCSVVVCAGHSSPTPWHPLPITRPWLIYIVSDGPCAACIWVPSWFTTTFLCLPFALFISLSVFLYFIICYLLFLHEYSFQFIHISTLHTYVPIHIICKNHKYIHAYK